jgi:hypothetical protein
MKQRPTLCERAGHPAAGVTHPSSPWSPMEISRCPCGQIWLRGPAGPVSLVETMLFFATLVVLDASIGWWGWLAGWAGPVGPLLVLLGGSCLVSVPLGLRYARLLDRLFSERGRA